VCSFGFLCFGLLANRRTIALLSLQTPFQKLAFDQPNVGVTLFPMVWLPGIIVSGCTFLTFVVIRKLLGSMGKKGNLNTLPEFHTSGILISLWS